MPRFPHSAWMLLKREWAKGNGKLNWKIERGKFLDLLLIMCTLFFRAIIDILTFFHFLHSELSAFSVFYTPYFLHPSISTLRLFSAIFTFYTPYFLHSPGISANRFGSIKPEYSNHFWRWSTLIGRTNHTKLCLSILTNQ